MNKHEKNCKRAGLVRYFNPVIPLRRRIAKEEVTIYQTLQWYVYQHRPIKIKQFYNYVTGKNTGSPITLKTNTAKERKVAHSKVVNLIKRCMSAGLIPKDSIEEFKP